MKIKKLKNFLKIKKPTKDYVVRLPTINELMNAFDRILGKPKIEGFKSSLYWSSTAYEGGKNLAWYVSFGDGYLYGNDKEDSSYVRCVKEYKDGRIEWLSTTEHRISWYEAIKYVEELNKE